MKYWNVLWAMIFGECVQLHQYGGAASFFAMIVFLYLYNIAEGVKAKA